MRITVAVYEALRPILNEMKEDIISSMKSDIVTIKATIINHTEEVFNEIVDNLMHKVEQHNNESESQLAAVRDLTTSTMASLDNKLSSMRDDFGGVERELSGLNNTANVICDKIEEHDNQITTELMKINETLTEQIINNSVRYTCGGAGNWRRAVYLDMTDPNTNCPSGWNMTGYSKRTCGRANSSSLSCDSVFFPVSGGPYSQVCGRIRAYQWGLPDAFSTYYHRGQTTIDSAYVSGVAVMYGSPRQHIWTFANGAWENYIVNSHGSICPCDIRGENNIIPPFVGEDYFCESGYVSGSGITKLILHSNDTLWDGRDCHSTSTCCSLHNPPYFTKTLIQTTTDDLQLRMCLRDSITADNIAVELVELYIK